MYVYMDCAQSQLQHVGSFLVVQSLIVAGRI